LEDYVHAVQTNDKVEIQSLQERVQQLEDQIQRMAPEEESTTEDADGSSTRMVHVHMLNGENFVTEWDELTPPLPPPPDHGLRSPIVFDLLSQWTKDTQLQTELMLWMEDVLDGNNNTSTNMIPPLELSNLDHQARDGFTMHILPLLLRRPDIHVQVNTRAHRQTSYDLSVHIQSNFSSNHHNSHHQNTVKPTPKRSIGG